MTTNPLITEARRLDSLKLTEGPFIARSTDGEGDSWQIVNKEGDVVVLMSWEDDAPFIAFAANHIIAFADKIEELEREIAQLREQHKAEMNELREFKRVELQGSIERARLLLDAKNHWMDRAVKAEQQVATLTQQTADLKAACEAGLKHIRLTREEYSSDESDIEAKIREVLRDITLI